MEKTNEKQSSLTGCTIYSKLFEIQNNFKIKKESYNSFGKYKFRSLEAMLSKLRPLLVQHRLVLTFSERIENFGSNGLVMLSKAIITDIDSGEQIENETSISMDDELKGMCTAQTSGADISYIRKYNLCGLLSVDDGSAELDSMDFTTTDVFAEKIEKCKTIAELQNLWGSMSDSQREIYKGCFTTKKLTLKV